MTTDAADLASAAPWWQLIAFAAVFRHESESEQSQLSELVTFLSCGGNQSAALDVCRNADVHKLAAVAERVMLDQALTPGREDGPTKSRL